MLRSAAIVLLVSMAGSASAQGPWHPPVSQVVTSADATVQIKPDRASISVGVQTRAATAAEAAAQNARKQQAIVDAIRGRGVPGDDIATANYSVSPEFRYREGETPLVTGFVVSNDVIVSVRSISRTGEIIDAALAAGANQINSLNFTVASPDSARRVALANAVVRARADAEAMARAAGGSLGQLLELTSTEQSIPVPRPVMTMNRAAAADASTPIEPGQQEVRASVTARWEFIGQP